MARRPNAGVKQTFAEEVGAGSHLLLFRAASKAGEPCTKSKRTQSRCRQQNELRPLITSRLDRFFRRLGRNQAIAARADEILPHGLDERLPHSKPVFRFEKLHQGTL